MWSDKLEFSRLFFWAVLLILILQKQQNGGTAGVKGANESGTVGKCPSGDLHNEH